MANTNQVTFSGSGNRGIQLGQNSGHFEPHIHLSPERPETPPSPTLLIPFARDADFVQSGTILNHIHKRCAVPGSRTALVGLGGIGKSQLAIEFAYQTRDRSQETWVFWVHASNAARLRQSYGDIADVAKIVGRHDPKANVFKLVHDWLRDDRRRWIVILDNVDDAHFLRDMNQGQPVQPDSGALRSFGDYLPHCPNGSVLITSRSWEAASKLVEKQDMIEIKPMTEVDAVTLFEKKLQEQENREAITALAVALEFMPLAIVQAAAYIVQRAPRCSVQQYIDDFRKSDKKKTSLLDYQGGELRRDSEATNSIIITWQISFSHIQQVRPGAADLLSLMSFCDRQGIPEILLRYKTRDTKEQSEEEYKQSHDSDEDDSGSQSSVDDGFEDSIQILRNFCFITVVDQRTFEMHRLVQLATRKWLRASGKLERWKHQYLQNLGAVLPTGSFEHWERCRTLFPHAKAAIIQRPKKRKWLKEWASILYRAAWYANEQGNNREAAEMAEQAVRVVKKVLSSDDQDMLGSLSILATIYNEQGRWKEAEELAIQVLETKKKTLGAEHPSTLIELSKLALIYWRQHRYDEAVELNVQLVEKRKKMFGAEDPSTLTSMANLALTYSDQGRWEEAEKLSVQVVEISKNVFGVEHPSTVTYMANLASTYSDQGRSVEAQELELQVVESSKKIYGLEHPTTLTTMCNLALTYADQGQWEEAEKLAEQVVETSKKALGAEHPSTLTYMSSLSSTYNDNGRFAEAEELEMQVIEKRKKVFGAEHLDTLTSMAILASTYWSQGRYEEASELEEQVMAVRRKTLGPEHPDTLLIMHNLARTWNAQDRTAEAITLMDECVEIRVRTLGTNHPHTLLSAKLLLKWRTKSD